MEFATRAFFFQSIICICLFLALLAAPASASPFSVVVRGTILDLNETDQTLLLKADCEHSWCQVNITGIYKGEAPGPQVFSSLKKGDAVEAVFNAWYKDLHDPKSGYINPSDDVRDIRIWRAVQKLAYGDNTSDLRGTDAFGDTVYFRAPLASGYAIGYDIRGPPPAEYNFRVSPPGTVANITLLRGPAVAGTWSLKAGESFTYTDPLDNSSLAVTFVGGYRPDTYALESCPCTNLAVRIKSNETTGSHIIPVTSSPATTRKAATALVLGIPALCGAFFIRRLR